MKQVHHLVCRHSAVFDRIYAAPESLYNAFRTLDVCGYGESQPMCFFAGCADDGGIHFQNARLPFLFRVHDAACDHQFDEIRMTVRDLLHILDGFLGRCDRVRKRSRYMSTGHRDARIGGEDPGTGCGSAGCAAAERRAKAGRRHCSQRNACHTGSNRAERIHSAAAGTAALLSLFRPLGIAGVHLISHFAVVIQDAAHGADRRHAAAQL